VAGLSASTAKAIVRHREANGPFAERAALNAVSGLGAKTFEQAAGFLRILGGANPLDASGVHPESYPLVERLLAKLGKPLADVMGKPDALKELSPDALVDESFGLFTVQDVLAELEKPGRDPRGSFKVARLADGVEDIKHLQAGMILEGTVSNVAAFGAFVDLGVHQDGLIHVSELAHRFVKDAREVVKTGDIVKVRVVEVDVARKRIALSMKLQDSLPKPMANKGAEVKSTALHNNERKNHTDRSQVPKKQANNQARKPELAGSSAMADAFAKLRK
jgi:protein Tex